MANEKLINNPLIKNKIYNKEKEIKIYNKLNLRLKKRKMIIKKTSKFIQSESESEDEDKINEDLNLNSHQYSNDNE